jgi:hypothetical protein
LTAQLFRSPNQINLEKQKTKNYECDRRYRYQKKAILPVIPRQIRRGWSVERNSFRRNLPAAPSDFIDPLSGPLGNVVQFRSHSSGVSPFKTKQETKQIDFQYVCELLGVAAGLEIRKFLEKDDTGVGLVEQLLL